ncbi:DHA2 family efflux MFS transporter permease subunit [Mucilaginibacter sp. UR6-11]|uniref:DHA2 family efflux MFS transporter permease subunit n=1 Tax=Mucilaginibacter sp. UR6-11 TaxID=1435644 RepID=UPI001E3BE847|nr:DHA2 family efflux MFS transporter permease subunit [Mucilaginibacter sp. UR6-11]MCC8423463.1 DHA2 family efflux MFS transporter permease subunit [Mucilaginibacter sp. UR6-11]
MSTVALNSRAGKWIMVSAILASAMAFIDATALNVVLPSLQQSLKATGADLFWILNAYLLMLASLILIGGAMGDKLGRRKVFMAGIFIFITGSAACGLSGSVLLLVSCRVIQGIGGALMIPGSLSLISSSINDKERGKAIGTWSAFTTVVTMGGPVLGGALADAGLWRYIFFINVPFGIAALLMLAFKVTEIKDEDNKAGLDFPGAITIALGLALITFGFLRIPAVGLYNIQAVGSLAAGIVFLLVFIRLEMKSNNPMMPLKLFTNATFSGANLLTFFLYAGLGAGMLFLSLNLVQIQGYSQLQSGLTFLPFTVLMITIARFAGSLADKHGPRLFLIVGPATAGLGLLLLSFVKQTTGPAEYWTTFFPGVLVLGLGMSFTVAPLTAAVMASVSDHFSGTASGVNNAMTRISGVFANAIFGALAVLFFSGALQKQIQTMPLSTVQRQQIMQQAINLGNAKVPAIITNAHKQTVENAYHAGFIAAYANIMRISAALGFLGALMALIFIKNKETGPA